MAGLKPVVIAEMKKNAFRIYLVGGAVRDTLLGRPVYDRDYVVIGGGREELLCRFPHAKPVGKRHVVYYVGGDEYTLSKAGTIEEDLHSRDLTINALAMDEKGLIIAHPRAFEHLENKLLYPVAQDNFFADPARVYRAARFAAWFPDFCVHPDLLTSMHHTASRGLCRSLAGERVGREVMKALTGPAPGRFVMTCYQGGALKGWFEELEQAASCPAEPFPHGESLLEQLCQGMDRLAGDPVRVWMALCHGMGSRVRSQKPCLNLRGYDRAEADRAWNLGRRLHLPRRLILAGMSAAGWCGAVAGYDTLSPEARVDLLAGVPAPDRLDSLCAVVIAAGGADRTERVLRDFRIIRNVHLPAGWRELGTRSGERLRNLRIQALAQGRTVCSSRVSPV